jgi:hypothetical protein
MKKSRWSLLLAVTVVMFYCLTTTVFADTDITAQHQLVSQAEGANGFDISLLFTIQNSGLESLSDVNLELVDPNLPAKPGTNIYYLGNLPAETDKQFTWNIISGCPLPNQKLPLILWSKVTDANGQPLEFSIISMGVSK